MIRITFQGREYLLYGVKRGVAELVDVSTCETLLISETSIDWKTAQQTHVEVLHDFKSLAMREIQELEELRKQRAQLSIEARGRKTDPDKAPARARAPKAGASKRLTKAEKEAQKRQQDLAFLQQKFGVK